MVKVTTSPWAGTVVGVMTDPSSGQKRAGGAHVRPQRGQRDAGMMPAGAGPASPSGGATAPASSAGARVALTPLP